MHYVASLSITTISELSWFRAVKDRLRSFVCSIGRSIGFLDSAESVTPSPLAPYHLHQGQRTYAPHRQAGHMTAADQIVRSAKIVLAMEGRPHMRRFGSRGKIQSRMSKLQWLFRHPRSEPDCTTWLFPRQINLTFGRRSRREVAIEAGSTTWLSIPSFCNTR